MDKEETSRIPTVLQVKKITVDDRCVEYLEMFRNEQYIELSQHLAKENPACVAGFCYYLAKYEGVQHLDFLRKLIGG
jgi:hypothetical protein